jgi:2-amino-4-hydroxy-6-hydroxymethyldihydropteridine diphosphokinase
VEIVIGLGANLGDPERAFARALAELDREHRVAAVSSLYRSRAVGPDQPDFLNLCALLDLEQPPLALLARCLALESEAGRDRSREQRWGPRVLDLDLLIARDVVHRGPRLELPHPRLAERQFALAPASELVGGWLHPSAGITVAALLDRASRRTPLEVVRLGSLP